MRRLILVVALVLMILGGAAGATRCRSWSRPRWFPPTPP